jgi:serine/threonine protein kinase
MSTNGGLGVGSESFGNGTGCGSASCHPVAGSPEQAQQEAGASSGTVHGEDSRVIAALETYLASLRDGRPWSRRELLERNADISDALSGCFSGLEFVEAAAAQLALVPGDPATAQAEPALPPQSRLGDYHILREVGRGGMGVVYEAQQISLDRLVALKVLPFAASVDPKQRQRFQIEAQAAAQLHHPHIVPIFGVGCDRGIHYYAMQFVDGMSLAAIIRNLRSGDCPTPAWAEPWPSPGPVEDKAACSPSADTADGGESPMISQEASASDQPRDANHDQDAKSDPNQRNGTHPAAPNPDGSAHQDRAFCRKVARLGIEAADALEHAHGLGVLHRDIKPANLLIDRGGAVWVTDFGLARFSGESSLTGSGDVVGTLRYMSPEQALARRGVVDQRTDIYALGATLYELLTLRPVFDGRDHQELLRQIAQDEPIPPRKLNSAVPRDLETIVLKAMAKSPTGRYATAQELAEDLKRFLNDDPIMGRRPGPVERTLRWARRHWEVVTTAAAILLLSLVVGAVVTWRQARATEEARSKYHDFTIRYYAILDRAAVGLVDQACALLRGETDPAARQRALQEYAQLMKLFEEASKLPPTDGESRVVIARALCRLAYARTMLGFQQGTSERPEPQLMAKAGSDFRESVARFEKLLEEERGNPTIRRYLADALGLKGMGCYLRFTQRPQEAELFYQRAIELRRDLLLRGGLGGVVDPTRPTDVVGEREDPMLLVYTVDTVASMMHFGGRKDDAERLYRQLEADVKAMATRYTGPQFQGQRRLWANGLLGPTGSATQFERRSALLNSRLATILDPANAAARNNLGWALTSVPDDPWFDPKQGLAEAKKAVELDPENSGFWNTLGVAAFRTKEWTTARDAFLKTIAITGGKASDWFFLAMTEWQQGHRDEALKRFERGRAALQYERKDDPEIVRFHTEAADLLGLPGPKVDRGNERPIVIDHTLPAAGK